MDEVNGALAAQRRRVGAYRDELKGLAILWVVFFHAMVSCGGVLGTVKELGYGGVDIFFFLTGFGLYHSLRKSEDLRGYWSRRLWRLLPAYLPLVILWMVIMGPSYGLSTVQAIRFAAGNLLMAGYWVGTPSFFNWYVAGLLLVIALAPACYALLTRSRKPLGALIALLAVSGIVGLTAIDSNTLMPLSRLPIFLLGMGFAAEWRGGPGKGALRVLYAAACALGLAAVLLCLRRYPELLIDYGLYWYPFALIIPGLCVGASFLLERAVKARALFAPLRLIGQSSFEIYLINIWMVEACKAAGVQGNAIWLLLCAGNLAVGVPYHLGVRRLTAWLKRARQA